MGEGFIVFIFFAYFHFHLILNYKMCERALQFLKCYSNLSLILKSRVRKNNPSPPPQCYMYFPYRGTIVKSVLWLLRWLEYFLLYIRREYTYSFNKNIRPKCMLYSLNDDMFILLVTKLNSTIMIKIYQ